MWKGSVNDVLLKSEFISISLPEGLTYTGELYDEFTVLNSSVVYQARAHVERHVVEVHMMAQNTRFYARMCHWGSR
jgi:hypothetical protein